MNDFERIVSDLASILARGVETRELHAWYAASDLLQTTDLRDARAAEGRAHDAMLALSRVAARAALLCQHIVLLVTRQSPVTGILLAFAAPSTRVDVAAELARRCGASRTFSLVKIEMQSFRLTWRQVRDTLDASLTDTRVFHAIVLALRARVAAPHISVARGIVHTAPLVLPVLMSTAEQYTLDEWPSESDDDDDAWE